jgi:uncharacterized Zn ribbon protein
MKAYYECPDCGDEFHVDDYDLFHCDICGYHVCHQRVRFKEDGTVESCDNCDAIKEKEDKINNLRNDIKLLNTLCLKNHKNHKVLWLNKDNN